MTHNKSWVKRQLESSHWTEKVWAIAVLAGIISTFADPPFDCNPFLLVFTGSCW